MEDFLTRGTFLNRYWEYLDDIPSILKVGKETSRSWLHKRFRTEAENAESFARRSEWKLNGSTKLN